MRLIDADALEKAGLIMVKLSDKEDKLLTKFEWKDVPLAYDVEAKVAELEESEKRLMFRNGNIGKTFYIPVNTAISIVRGKE